MAEPLVQGRVRKIPGLNVSLGVIHKGGLALPIGAPILSCRTCVLDMLDG